VLFLLRFFKLDGNSLPYVRVITFSLKTNRLPFFVCAPLLPRPFLPHIFFLPTAFSTGSIFAVWSDFCQIFLSFFFYVYRADRFSFSPLPLLGHGHDQIFELAAFFKLAATAPIFLKTVRPSSLLPSQGLNPI